MHAASLIVEYNPFHNGHVYHIQETKTRTGADCIVAVMSGPFMQRGEPAMIDKYHRTKAALENGVDLVVELPYAYAVQHADLFAKGALQTLHELHVETVCFGSEHGEIDDFTHAALQLRTNKAQYKAVLTSQLERGIAFPEASQLAYNQINIDQLALHRPNNILGFSYVKTILEHDLPITPITIKRIANDYHDRNVNRSIASATSIRAAFLNKQEPGEYSLPLPDTSYKQCVHYKNKAGKWHQWEHYFPYLRYHIISMSRDELAMIHGVDEGLENRIKNVIHEAKSFRHLLELVKSRRYTVTRLQRMFVHILTNTTKDHINEFLTAETVPYIRLLGMTSRGQRYLNHVKKKVRVPLITRLNRQDGPLVALDEKAQNCYSVCLHIESANTLRNQTFQLPIIER